MLETPILATILSFIVAVSITPLIIAWYRKNKWLDDPTQGLHAKKVHSQALPRGGGLIIFAAVIIATLFFLPLTPQLIGILAGATLLMGVGFLDDVYDVHPFIRLLVGLLAALIVVGSGIGIAYVSNPISPGVIHLDQPQIQTWLFGKELTILIVADLFAVFFILWNMNIVNWSKGVDGQMPGFVSIALLFIGFLSTKFLGDPTQFNVLTLSWIVAGAFAGFLVWNMYPQKIMAGYGAGSLAGYFLAVLAILSGAKVATSLMVLAIPTADAIFTITRRLIAGKSPWWGDRGHLHHKLMDVLGWSKSQIALFYWITSLIMGLGSLFLSTPGKIITIGVCTLLVFAFLVWAKLVAHTPIKNHA